MDIFETPYAEDFAMELDELIEEYMSRGLSLEACKIIIKWNLEEIDSLTSGD